MNQNYGAKKTGVKRRRCQTGERDDQTAGKAHLTQVLVAALSRHTGQDSALNCLDSVTHQHLTCVSITVTDSLFLSYLYMFLSFHLTGAFTVCECDAQF